MQSHAPEPDVFWRFGPVGISQIGSAEALSNQGYLLWAVPVLHTSLQSQARTAVPEHTPQHTQGVRDNLEVEW